MRRWFSVVASVAIVAGYLAVQRPVIAGAVDVPSVTVGDATMWEGNAGSMVVSIPVDLSAPSTTKTSVQYWVHPDNASGNPASVNDDFIGGAEKLTFAAGQTSKLVSVFIYGDTMPETDENIAIDLYVPNGVTLAKPHGDITILDDDSEGTGSGITVSLGSFTVVEANAGTHTATIPVTLSAPAPATIKVQYAIDCGTAGVNDYTAQQTGTITFAAGTQSKSISFNITADTAPETLAKSVLESMSVVLGPAMVRTTDGQGIIIDNDTAQAPSTGWPTVGHMARVSVASDGSEGAPTVQTLCDGNTLTEGSDAPAMSADGRYVTFRSMSPNLVPGDTNGIYDVFVHDITAGTTERVSSLPDGSQITTTSAFPWMQGADYPAISGDGRYVTFSVTASTGLGLESEGQLYLRDRSTGLLELVSAAPDGSYANGGSTYSSISADGRYVAFASDATNLVPGAGAGVYVRDRFSGTTRFIFGWSSTCGSAQGDICGTANALMALSGNGRYLAFNSSNTDVVPNDTNDCADTFVRDLVTGATERVSITSNGSQQVTSGVGHSCSTFGPKISSDGRYVGFSSGAWNIDPGGAPGPANVTPPTLPYVHDRVTGTTTMVNFTGNAIDNAETLLEGMSDDGRYVTYFCSCGDPVSWPGPMPDHLTVWADTATGTTRILGEQPNGIPPIDQNTGYFTFEYSFNGLAADGLHVAFSSYGSNIVPGDNNDIQDVFIETLG